MGGRGEGGREERREGGAGGSDDASATMCLSIQQQTCT